MLVIMVQNPKGGGLSSSLGGGSSQGVGGVKKNRRLFRQEYLDFGYLTNRAHITL